MSHNTSPREKGQEETRTFQVLSHQAEEAPSAVGITSNPSVEGSGAAGTTPVLAALTQGVLTLGGSGAKELLSSVHGEQPPLQQVPRRGSLARLIYHTGFHCPTSPACRNFCCTCSLSPHSCAVSPEKSSRPLGNQGRAMPLPCFTRLTSAPPHSCGLALFHTAAAEQKSSLIKRASFGNRQIHCTTQSTL